MHHHLARFFIAVASCTACIVASAQEIIGSVPTAAAGKHAHMVLYRTYGGEHIPLDSAHIEAKGLFRFPPRAYPLGYYRLGFAEDQVDLILGTTDGPLKLDFGGSPLQEHITVSGSVENQRLWEYKWASRDAQRRRRFIVEARVGLDPRDREGLERLAAEELLVQRRQQDLLNRLISQDSSSYFAKVVVTDQRVMAALEQGPLAVRNAMRWTDPSLVRSAVYGKAIMALLQSSTPATPDMLIAAADSVLAWAEADTLCWGFARATLVEVFATYGPEEVVQHLVDRYMVGPGTMVPPDHVLLATVADQLRTAVGSQAPDVELPSPITGKRDQLSILVHTKTFTALFFYSSTCDHCHMEMPGLSALYDRYASQGFNIVGIALDDQLQEFTSNIEEQSLRFPCYSELQAWGSPAAKAFAVKSTPKLILLDRTGRIIAKPRDQVELHEILQGLFP
ncbi:MAG: TlpA family protein disulfide reductase [Flavobacteriales bacterium]|nr:TlpA family protein disulfide reductase [Flavobacteriales bacterium]